MEITEFQKRMKTAKPLSHSKRYEHILTMIHNSDAKTDFTIAVEEMSELTQLLTKNIREVDVPYERDRVLEEMADVLICFNLIQEWYGISDKDISKAIAVKLERNVKRIKRRFDNDE